MDEGSTVASISNSSAKSALLSLVTDTLDILSWPVLAEKHCRKLLRNWQQEFKVWNSENSSVAYRPLNVYVFTLKESELIFILNYMNNLQREKQLKAISSIQADCHAFFFVFCHLLFHKWVICIFFAKKNLFQAQSLSQVLVGKCNANEAQEL